MRAPTPVRLSFTTLAGPLAEGHAAVCGADKWPVRLGRACLTFSGVGAHPSMQVLRDARPFLDVFAERRSSLVYLTADSPVELTELSPDDVYVVGGIVDRNRHKRLTLSAAEAAGIRHARLPLAQHVTLAGSAVLTVNQVLELLLAQLELKDWHAACDRVVPKRKRGAEGVGQEQLGRKARRLAAAEARTAAGLAPAAPAEGDDDDDDDDEEEADAPEGGEE